MTKRVVECLTVAAETVRQPTIRSARLIDLATDLLAEADHLFSQDKLASAAVSGSNMYRDLRRIESRLLHARKLLRDRPGTAVALASDILAELDELRVARDLAGGGT
jgi:hypothetical protein